MSTNSENNADFSNIINDYEKTASYFYTLHDVRFKLLGFLPFVTGLGVYALPDDVSNSMQLAVAFLGFLITAGLASYDQRNTQIYDRLIKRLRFLEKRIRFLPLPGEEYGGAFHCRPKVKRVFGIRFIWHIQGLTIVYAASFTGWLYLGTDALVDNEVCVLVSTLAGFIISYIILRIISSTHHSETKELGVLIESK